MQIVNIVATLSGNMDAPTQSMLGLGALAAELAAEGISVKELFASTGAQADQLEDPHARISRKQRLSIYRNAIALAARPDVGLLAGSRQRISDYGIYGYAMVTSPTFGEALKFALEHITHAGTALPKITLRIDGKVAILQSHGIHSLGNLLPFIAEFWRSSMTALFSRVLEAPFPSSRMMFTYPAPAHWRNYERMFNCPVEFNASSMEWHFPAELMDRPCPNANPITAKVCQQFCDILMAEGPEESSFVRRIRTACLNSPHRFPTAETLAGQLGFSLRTLHRRLAQEGVSYRSVIDDMRRVVATEFLENTHLMIDEVAERVGFSDATSFRRAFRKWTGHAPTYYRRLNLQTH